MLTLSYANNIFTMDTSLMKSIKNTKYMYMEKVAMI